MRTYAFGRKTTKRPGQIYEKIKKKYGKEKCKKLSITKIELNLWKQEIQDFFQRVLTVLSSILQVQQSFQNHLQSTPCHFFFV